MGLKLNRNSTEVATREFNAYSNNMKNLLKADRITLEEYDKSYTPELEKFMYIMTVNQFGSKNDTFLKKLSLYIKAYFKAAVKAKPVKELAESLMEAEAECMSNLLEMYEFELLTRKELDEALQECVRQRINFTK